MITSVNVSSYIVCNGLCLISDRGYRGLFSHVWDDDPEESKRITVYYCSISIYVAELKVEPTTQDPAAFPSGI